MRYDERQYPIEFFSSVTDPRILRTQKHSLDAILFISLCAISCGADGWNEIEDYGNAKIDWLRKFLPLPNGIPSHNIFNLVISMLDPKELNDSFVAWTKSVAELTDGEVVAIDGKCMRGSSDEGTGTYTHLVSAWASANNLLLAQEKVAGKSSEITAIPRLLRILELVTIDAMGCQREIAKTIIERGADYILALKANQPEMLERVSGSFTYIKPSSVHTMQGKSHGREDTHLFRNYQSGKHHRREQMGWIEKHSAYRVPLERHQGWNHTQGNSLLPVKSRS